MLLSSRGCLRSTIAIAVTRVVMLCLFGTVCTPLLSAQSDFSAGWTTTKKIYSFGNRWNGTDALTLGGSAAATVLASLWDDEVKALTDSNRSPAADFLFTLDSWYGGVPSLGVVAVPYVYGIIKNDEDARQLGVQLGAAAVSSLFITHLLKVVIGRARPKAEVGNSMFAPLSFKGLNTSFPSGHTALAFTLSTVLAEYKGNAWWKGGWYGFAVIASAARVYNDEHWLSDIVAGACIGHFVGTFVARQVKLEAKNATRAIPPSPVFTLLLPL